MYSFPIGVRMKCLRMSMKESVEMAAKLGLQGLQIPATSVETAFSLNLKKDEGTIQLFGTKAGAKLDPELEMYSVENGYMANVNLCTPTALSFGGLFQNEIDHSVDCVLNGTPCKSPAEDGATLMKTLDAIYESTRTGHEVVIQ